MLQAQSNETLKDVRSIERYVTSVDSAKQRAQGRVLLFAKIRGQVSLKLVPTDKDWPDDTEVSYNVFPSKSGKILYYLESPSSQSGDSQVVFEHYFDLEGDVVLFVYSVSAFNSQCTPVLRQETKLYFDPNFCLIGKASKLTDVDYRPISPDGCDFNYKYSFTVHPLTNRIPKAVLQGFKLARGVAP